MDIKAGFQLDDNLGKLLAEVVGAFTLIFIGGGAILSGAELEGVAFAHGLAIAVMVCALGHISGAHFNPAVTFGFLVTRRMDPLQCGAYVVAQLLGAVLAAIGLKVAWPDDVSEAANLAVPALGSATDIGAGIFMEAVTTFFLVFVVFAVAVDKRGSFKFVAGLPIGFVILMDILAIGPLTGGAMNPARWFGPALIGGSWDDAIVWIIGPLLGGAIGAVLYDQLLLRGTDGDPDTP
jgi:MIP family channel proteins